MLVLTAVGLRFGYSGLAGLLNKTRIEISQDMLIMSHQPLSQRKPVELPITSIKRIYAQKMGAFPGLPFNSLLAELEGGETKALLILRLTASDVDFVVKSLEVQLAARGASCH